MTSVHTSFPPNFIGHLSGMIRKNGTAVFVGGYLAYMDSSHITYDEDIGDGTMVDKNLQYVSLSLNATIKNTETYGNTKYGEGSLINNGKGDSLLGILKLGTPLFYNASEFKIDINGIATLLSAKYPTMVSDAANLHTWGVDIPHVYGEHKGKIISTYKNRSNTNTIARLKECHNITIG